MKDAKIIQNRTISIFKEYQMSKLQEKQSQLNELYKNKFLGENTYIELEKYSPPLLLNLDVENLDTRIMFVGQETNWWYDDENSNWRNEN